MDIWHRLQVTPSPAGLLFECVDGCGRRLAVDRRSGGLTVIDKGDQFASHSGAHGEVALGPASIEQP